MRAINHSLTGALIGLTVAEPAIALPVAIASHYVLDMIPHYGSSLSDAKALKTTTFKLLLLIDALLCGLLVLALSVHHPVHWLVAAVCAFVAASPDFLSLNRFLQANKNKLRKPKGYVALAQNIQWFQRPIGAVVEIAWFIAAVIFLTPFLT